MPDLALLSLGDLSEQIRVKQHASLPFRVPRNEFQGAIDAFTDFLALPQEIKDPIYKQLDPGNRGSEVGYKKYRRELGNTDNREYFHYHENADESFAEAMSLYPELARFIETAKPIYTEAKSTMEQIITSFDGRFPGLHEQFFPPNEFPDFYLRFLKYDRLAPGEFLAKGHYDRGGCTLALAESAPGLRMGLTDKDVREVVHAEGQALFMPGIKFRDVTSDDFPPTWHDVVQKSEHGYREDIARWAIVFFAGTLDMRNTTYEQAHTPRY